MIVRICDKVVNAKGRERIKNIRRVECTDIYDTRHCIQTADVTLCNVLLYIDPKTNKATVIERYLKDMKEVT